MKSIASEAQGVSLYFEPYTYIPVLEGRDAKNDLLQLLCPLRAQGGEEGSEVVPISCCYCCCLYAAWHRVPYVAQSKHEAMIRDYQGSGGGTAACEADLNCKQEKGSLQADFFLYLHVTCNTYRSVVLSSIFALVYASVAVCTRYAHIGCAQSVSLESQKMSFDTALNPSLELDAPIY